MGLRLGWCMLLFGVWMGFLVMWWILWFVVIGIYIVGGCCEY